MPKKETPLVSILIPAYNAEEFLSKAIDSVLNQSYKNIEIVSIDDGSTDKTNEILKQYIKAHPKIIRSFTQENLGEGRTRNALIEKARGEYFVFLDADDWLKRDYVKTLLSEIEQYDLVVSGYELYNANYQFVASSHPSSKEFSKYSFCMSGGKMWRRSFVIENHLCYEPLTIGTDSLFSVCAYSKTKAIKTIPYNGYCIYVNEKSVSRNVTYDDSKSFLTVAKKAVDEIHNDSYLTSDYFRLFLLKSLLVDIVLYKKSLNFSQLLALSRKNLSWYKAFLVEHGQRNKLILNREVDLPVSLFVNSYILFSKCHLDRLLIAAVKYSPLKLPWS